MFWRKRRKIDNSAIESLLNKSFSEWIDETKISGEKLERLAGIIKAGTYASPHLSGDNRNYSKYIILTTNRTGSNYLRSFLMTSPNIVCFGELFNQERVLFNYPGFPDERDKNILAVRNFDSTKFAENFIYRNYHDNIKAVGFKMMYHNQSEGNDVWNYLRELKGLKVIHLRRKNLLDSLISLKLAEKTNIWSVIDEDFARKAALNDLEDAIPVKMLTSNDENTTLEIDYNLCNNYFDSVTKYASHYSRYFSKTQVEEVFYEDLQSNPRGIIDRVFDFIEIERKECYSPMKKVNNRSASEVISNYNELKDKFKGTQWSHFFID